MNEACLLNRQNPRWLSWLRIQFLASAQVVIGHEAEPSVGPQACWRVCWTFSLPVPLRDSLADKWMDLFKKNSLLTSISKLCSTLLTMAQLVMTMLVVTQL